MRLKRYGEYKDSRVKWLGEVPEHWAVKRLDLLASVKARLGWKGLKADEYVDSGYAFLSTPNIKGEGEIDFDNVNYITEERYIESPEIQLKIGDLLLAKDGSTLGIANYVRHLPFPATVNSSIAVIRANSEINGAFLFRWFTGAYVQEVIQYKKDGQGVPHLFQDDIRRIPVILPPLDEQGAIISFLDLEIGKIDTLISEQQDLITLLREKRQAVISHAIMRGLSPDTSMKDSGIEGFGRIPAHWIISPMRHLINSIEQGWSPECENIQADEGEWGVVKAGCCNGGDFNSHENKKLPSIIDPITDLEIKPGDMLMSRASGSEDLIGSIAIVSSDVRSKLLLSDKIYRIRPKSDRVCPRFLAMAIQSPLGRGQIKSLISGAPGLAKNISQGDVKGLIIPLPPMDEQIEIMSHLDMHSSMSEGIVIETESCITLLRERRMALISAVVTGKVDVREVACV